MSAKAKPKDDNDLGGIASSKLALLFGVTVARLGQLQSDGIVTKRGKGEYDLWKSVAGYVAYLQKKRRGGGDDVTSMSMDEAKLKKTQTEAAILEHKLAIQKGEYVSAESQIAEGMKLGIVIRGIFQRAEPDLTPRLAGRTAAEVSTILREYMNAKLIELSQYDSPVEIPTD